MKRITLALLLAGCNSAPKDAWEPNFIAARFCIDLTHQQIEIDARALLLAGVGDGLTAEDIMPELLAKYERCLKYFVPPNERPAAREWMNNQGKGS